MTFNAKVLAAGLGLVALVAAPAAATAKTHYAPTHHSHWWQHSPRASLAWRYGGARRPLYTHYGNIRDRQTYGLGY